MQSCSEILALLLLSLATSQVVTVEAFKSQVQHALVVEGNPIRKVVSMMEKMAKKVEEEGKTEEELYEKFECYCKKTSAELEKSISIAVSSPLSQADIESKRAEVESLEASVKKLKEDRLASEDTLKAAEAQRSKEHRRYEEEHQEDAEVVTSISQASQALKGGAPALLQADKTRMLRAVERSSRLEVSEKQQIMSLLSGEAAKTDPDYVLGILNAMKADTKEKISSDAKGEESAVENFGDLETSKKTEISTLLEQLERKMKRTGELKVEIVDLQRSLAGASDSLAEDRKMLEELKKSCAAKATAWDARREQRNKELVALQETIKILDSDKSLDLFRGSSFIQTSADEDARREHARKLLLQANEVPRMEINFLALALAGKQVDFSKILEKVDSMVALLKTEDKDDEAKKAYCVKQFHAIELKNHSQQQDILSLSASITQKADATKQLAGEVKVLQDGVATLDQSIAEAGENRKAEHRQFQKLMADDSSAVQLLGMAKQRLYKVYHPTPAALVAVAADSSIKRLTERYGAPPSTFEGGYQAQKSFGVLSMMDTLKADLEQEMSIAKTEESHAQKDYEETLGDAAKKREADLSLTAEKSKTKADLEVDLQEDKVESSGKKKEAAATAEFAGSLHKECDWLLQNFELRKQARADEKENLLRAKTVLAGA